MRCDFCGRDMADAIFHGSLTCAPPFRVQRHAFAGKHPADATRDRGSSPKAETPQSGSGRAATRAPVAAGQSPEWMIDYTIYLADQNRSRMISGGM